MSIKAKLLALVLGVFLFGVGGTTLWNEMRVEQAVLNILKAKQQEGAELAVATMQQAIGRLQFGLDELARADYVQDLLQDATNAKLLDYAHDRLLRLKQGLPELSGVAIANTRGLVIASSSTEASGKLDISDRAYMKKALQGEPAISDPAQSRVTGKPSVMIAMPVRKNGGVIGAVYMTVDLQHVFADVTRMKSGNEGYAFVLDKNGIMLYHPDAKRIFVDTSKEDWARPLRNGAPSGYFECDFSGAKWLVNYATMPSTGWIVLLNAEDSDLLSSILAIRNQTVAGYAVLFVIIALAVWLFARRLGQSFEQGIAFATRVEDGDFDARWQTTKRDELGKLAASLNVAFGKAANQAVWFKSLLNAIKAPILVMDLDEKVTFMNGAFGQLAGSQTEKLVGQPCTKLGTAICGTERCAIRCLQRGETSTHFVKDGHSYDVFVYKLHDKDGKHVGYIEVLNDVTEQEKLVAKANAAVRQGKLDAANQLESVVEIISSASAELSAQIEHSEQGAEAQAARVMEVATAMNEMNATVLEVSSNASSTSDISASTRTRAEEGSKVVQEVVKSIRAVQQKSLTLKDDMTALGDSAQSISQIMGVISDIADQTNLLALNAAIEAARAGEAGRGFAVVADEVRKLAEKTMQSTTDVGNAIRGIQQSAEKSRAQVDDTVHDIETATELAGRSGEALAEIVRMVDNTADQVRTIATASEEQSATSEQINQSVIQVSTIANETVHAMSESARAVEELSSQMQVLTRLIEDMKRG